MVESSSSGSNFSDTQKNLIWKRQQHAQQGHITTDTKQDDDDNNGELADQVDPDPGTADTLWTEAGPSKDNGKQNSPLKHGRLLTQAKEEISAFSTEVLGMAQNLADRLRISRKNVLISAGFGIKESRGENIANLHAQWYATMHTKLDGSAYLCASSSPF